MMEQEERARMEIEHDSLYQKVLNQYAICEDEGVSKFFNVGSERMLKKKLRILTELNKGTDRETLGGDYFKILEDIPRDENGEISIEIDW